MSNSRNGRRVGETYRIRLEQLDMHILDAPLS